MKDYFTLLYYECIRQTSVSLKQASDSGTSKRKKKFIQTHE